MSQMIMMIQRDLRKVPLDFKWDLNKVWWGYKRECGTEDCEGCEYCKDVEPPTGEGFQLWESVSEGSPVSPVFDTKEKLCRWLADTKREYDITNHFTYEDWAKIIEDECPCMDMHTNELLKSRTEPKGE